MPRSTRNFACVVAVLVLALPTAGAGATDAPSVPEFPTLPINLTNPTPEAEVAADSIAATKAPVVLKKKKKSTSRAARGFKYVRATSGSVSASFGERSRYWSVRHTGIDYDASYGARVKAVLAGKVVFAGRAGAYGNLIVIKAKGGAAVWYAHLSSIKVKVGKKVKRSQFIGRVGSTGNSTGSHLHLEIRRNDYPIDPAKFLLGKYRGRINKMRIPSWAYGSGIQHFSGL
jgi:murein DD-endopeptidase MepM/ murein hydrolase activator NlpD